MKPRHREIKWVVSDPTAHHDIVRNRTGFFPSLKDWFTGQRYPIYLFFLNDFTYHFEKYFDFLVRCTKICLWKIFLAIFLLDIHTLMLFIFGWELIYSLCSVYENSQGQSSWLNSLCHETRK